MMKECLKSKLLKALQYLKLKNLNSLQFMTRKIKNRLMGNLTKKINKHKDKNRHLKWSNKKNDNLRENLTDALKFKANLYHLYPKSET